MAKITEEAALKFGVKFVDMDETALARCFAVGCKFHRRDSYACGFKEISVDFEGKCRNFEGKEIDLEERIKNILVGFLGKSGASLLGSRK